ncbi:ABC-2 type transport system ATP-binding protein [Clostridium cavendishii DSM 21758]|uniref:ABC-2 type transport system ATP-binding protein n=1 Tax=Clostridium cavendishii DSM 21758 TaxID=1121302 RepID=A0A1M6T5A7_9CLOT|nr:ABC transporter ATP-binding protein [Clostridium cavendishii]SHK51948.1 ABC-2 type transport system ATP-binding protein [Clostridium cavendishii DSM 21758]
MSIIKCVNLSKLYGKNKSLSDISFTIEEDTITGIIGRNGAGKTTLLKIIAGFIKNTSGEISVLNNNPFDNLYVATNIFFSDDNMVFPSSLNLSEILKEAGKLYPNWDTDLSNGLFEYFKLNPKQYHQKLSKGQKSTFNMIIALASHSPITIFDEPTTGMDASVRKDFYKALLKDYIKYPRTILLSSHLLSEIEDILENIVLIKNGQTVLQMPIEELKEMAIGLRGDKNYINEITNDKEIIHTENITNNNIFVVVKNDFSGDTLQNIKLAGTIVSPVSTDDLCVYLTADSKGGIDDVFNKNKSI